MPANDGDIDADPQLYAAVTVEIRNPDGSVIPAGTEVEVHLTADMPRVYDPRTGIRARVPLILLDPDI